MSDSNYLSPGVYIQELEGPAPIVGVSTSIAAFIGMAERGPVNVPILCSSPGDYTRWFGGLLVQSEFADPVDPNRAHCYLPYAVAGFFNNSGQVSYVMRVVPDEASYASELLYDRGNTLSPTSTLIKGAAVGDGSGTTPAAGALIMLAPVPPFVLPASIRIGNGSASEYQSIQAVGTVNDAIPLDLPLQLSHASVPPTPIAMYARTVMSVNPITLTGDVNPGDTTIYLQTAEPLTGASYAIPAAPAAPPWLLEFDSLGVAAISVPTTVASVGTNLYAVTLSQPLALAFSSAAGTTALNTLHSAPVPVDALDVAASGGDVILYASGAAVTPGYLIDIDPGNSQFPLLTREVRTIGALTQLSLAQPASVDWPAKSLISPAALVPAAATSLTAAATAGSQVLTLASRTNVNPGTILLLGAAPTQEFAVVIAVQGVRALAGLDPGSVVLDEDLVHSYPNGVAVIPNSINPTVPAGRRATPLLTDTDAGGTTAVVTWGAGWVLGDIIQVSLPDGTVAYNTISAAPVAQALSAVELTAPVQQTHPAGSPIVERSPLIQVQALDVGAWGQRVAIAVQDESPGLVALSQVVALTGLTQLQLTSLNGIQPGSYLELLTPGGAVIDPTTPLKVSAVNPSTTTITIDSAVSPSQSAAIGAVISPARIGVRSREFRITVYLYRHPDPAVPARNTQVIQTETFRNLSMDPRHSQYFQTVIGSINGPLRLSDRRPEGSSWLIRTWDTVRSDLTLTPAQLQAALQAPRLGPEALIDVLPNGLQKPAQLKLTTGGDDSLATVDDEMYIGADATDPLNRTGIYALQNVPQVSIVAIPGQGTPAIQSALIDFCETSMYCFAVLDPQYPDSAIADIQAQRQGFDTKYAAIYYPWLTIPNPLPANLAVVPNFALPPSGHVVGIYARVDDSRGVFKAPANEVVQGITGLTRTLVQGDQDVLNPEPNNINVIRDFRPQGRGIRVWGARVMTSDDNYKYVPVRRLLIFIEESLNLGLQDIVFEPNGPQLWASVERLITNFLNNVWASGALQGATPDQSFFVRCDLTTMTQDDIDAGRLIALVGVAPVMPAEFVIIQIALMTATTSQ